MLSLDALVRPLETSDAVGRWDKETQSRERAEEAGSSLIDFAQQQKAEKKAKFCAQSNRYGQKLQEKDAARLRKEAEEEKVLRDAP
eukprot:Skav233663  [mRNA]  locus=scaffold976:55392:56847:- [translate_table: standard]